MRFLISAIVPVLMTGEVREGSGQFDQGYVLTYLMFRFRVWVSLLIVSCVLCDFSLQGQRVGFASALQEYQGGSASHQAYGVGQGQAIP